MKLISINLPKISIVAMVTLLVFGYGVVSAQAQTITDIEKQIQALLKQVEQLRSELRDQQSSTQTSSSSSGRCEANFARSLERGDRGSEVSRLQEWLQSKGYYTYGEITGYYGPVTEAAVKAFQRAEGVVSQGDPWSTGYGRFGTLTRSRLNALCGDVVEEIEKEVTTKRLQADIDVIDIDAYRVVIEFEMPRTCAGYVVEWGDGDEDEFPAVDEGNCSSTKETIMLGHTYEKTGRYLIELTLEGEGYLRDRDSKRITVNGEDEIIPPETFNYNDIETVTTTLVDPIAGAADDEYTLFRITLKNGSVLEVKRYDMGEQSTFEQSLSAVGYVGSVERLLALAGYVTIPPDARVPTPPTYKKDDIASVTVRDVDPSSSRAGDEYRIYTITLKNGAVHRVRSYGNAPASAFTDALAKTGFVGTKNQLDSLARPDLGDDARVPTPPTYKKDDIASVTVRDVDPSSSRAGDEYRIYTITLKNGAVHRVRSYGNAPASAFTDALAKTGFVGTKNQLDFLVRAYDLRDIASVTKKQIDPDPRRADDEYILYTVDLKDPSKQDRRIRQYGNAPASDFEKRLRNSGFEGTVASFLNLVP